MMLEARDIQKAYDNGKGRVEVLKGVNLAINKGEFVAIAGPSGAGKSTLLHILGGLDKPTQGQVIFEGHDIYSLSDTALSKIRNQKIGFVFQFYHLLSEFTALENVFLPEMIRARMRVASSELQANTFKALEQVGLQNRAAHFPNQLSGGEQQRVAICRALVNRPEILLCDEPTGNLDSKTGEEIISMIRKINQERSMTVVLVTHNIELTKRADKVYSLRDGILMRG